MAKLVRRWESSDGTLFNSQQEAEYHDAHTTIQNNINQWCVQWLDGDMCIGEIADQMLDSIDELREAIGCGT